MVADGGVRPEGPSDPPCRPGRPRTARPGLLWRAGDQIAAIARLV